MQQDLHEPGGVSITATDTEPAAERGDRATWPPATPQQTRPPRPTPTPQSPVARRLAAMLGPAAVAAIVVGVVLRAGARSQLWLDEVLSLNIAGLPVDQIGGALRQDGAPPFYYLLLHGWTRILGDSALAARSLSALFSVAALPLAWAAGRRLGGSETAWTAVLLFASSPFAIRYATEVRMYALVQLLVLGGYLLLRRALEHPTRRRLVGLGLVTGLLPLTHYWTLFLLAVTAVILLVLRRDERQRASATSCLLAMGAGGALFVPWAPSFLFQVRHTGNPWDPPAELGRALLTAFLHFGGSFGIFKFTLGCTLATLTLVAAVAHRLRARTDDPGHAAWPPGAIEASLGLGALVLGIAISGTIGAAFSSRYASAMFPIVLLAATGGIRSLRRPRVRQGVVALAVVVGLLGGVQNMFFSRTQAGEVAAAITAGAEPGDVVAFCPDQLGPAVSRMLPEWLHQLTYPYGGSPERVNWVDYAQRNRQADPTVFARFVDAVAGPRHAVWLVWREGYRTFGGGCERTATALRLLRPGSTVEVTPATGGFETHYVTRSPGS